jgi:hypothetical protein
MSLKQISFILRTTGLTILNVLNRLKVPGTLITTLAIVLISLVLNLRTFEEYSSIGLKGISNLSKLIASCNMTIAFLDKLEELRPLYPQEFNFKKIIKVHISNLLRM